MYSPIINNLIRQLKHLPAVGQHTAERFVFHWLKSGKKEVTELMLALKEMIENVKSCERCWNFSDTNPCFICRDQKRDQSIVCVVAGVQDLAAIERTSAFRGVYHVLRTTLDPSNEDSLRETKIPELLVRISRPEPASPTTGENKITEVILALSSDISGETTGLYLDKEIKKHNPALKVTRLARGLPMGSDLAYADQITLASALAGRTKA